MNVQWCWAATLWNGCPTSGNCVRWALPFFFCWHFLNFQHDFHILVGILQINFNNSFSEHFHILWRNYQFFPGFFFKRDIHKKDSLIIECHYVIALVSISWCVGQICRFSARLLYLATLGEIYLYSGRTHTVKWFGGNAVFWVIDSKAISFVGNKLVREWNLILKKCNRVFSFFGWPILFGHWMKMLIWSKTLNRNHCV